MITEALVKARKRAKRAIAVWAIGPAAARSIKQVPDADRVGNLVIQRNLITDALFKEWSADVAIRDGFKVCSWVYACVWRRMKAVASARWKVQRRTRQNLWRDVPGHPCAELIEYPNGQMSRQDMMERVVSHLDLAGNSLLWPLTVNRGQEVKELWPLSPDRVTPIVNDLDFILRYRFRPIAGQSRGEKFYKPEDLIHFMFTDPANPAWGMGPLQAVARVVDTDVEAVRWNKVSLQNRMVKDGMISFKQDLTQDQHDQVVEWLRDHHEGANASHGVVVMGNEATFTPFSMSPSEYDFLESRAFSVTEISSVFGVPPPLISVYDNATLANIETARKIFWQDTIIPLLEDLRSTFDRALLVPYFLEPNQDPRDWRVMYDLSEVEALQEDFGESVDVAKTMVEMGVPLNLAASRMDLGIPKIDGGDVGYVASAKVPVYATGQGRAQMVSMAALQEATPVPGGNEPVTEPTEEVDDRELEEGGEEQRSRARFGRKALDLEQEGIADYIESVDTVRESNIRRMKPELVKQFEAEERRVLRLLRGGTRTGTEFFEGSQEAWEEILAKALTMAARDGGELVERSFESATKKFFRPLWSEKQMDEEEEEDEEAVPFWLRALRMRIRNVAIIKAAGILTTSRTQLEATLQRGIAENEEPARLEERVTNLFDRYKGSRTDMIALTEVVGGANMGAREAAGSFGIPLEKTWITQRDENVRNSHAALDSTTVFYNEAYPNGLMFPGDPSGAGDQVIGCRCYEVYRSGAKSTKPTGTKEERAWIC